MWPLQRLQKFMPLTKTMMLCAEIGLFEVQFEDDVNSIIEKVNSTDLSLALKGQLTEKSQDLRATTEARHYPFLYEKATNQLIYILSL